MQRYSSRALVIIPLLLVALLLQGCMGNASPNFTSPANAAAEADGPDGTRLSLAFFERSLAGRMRVYQLDQEQPDERSSDVVWKVAAPTAELPQDAEILADFRERQGCAAYKDLNGLKLCFTVVPDISSLGVNEHEVTVRGLKEALNIITNENGECTQKLTNVRFAGAVHEVGRLSVSFAGQRPAECGGQAVLVDLVLRQI